MLNRRQLLTIAALLECLVGLALVLAPGQALVLLLGTNPDRVSLMLGPVAGIALSALGICCWGARTDMSGPAFSATFKGITLYNAGAGFFLLFFAASGRAFGVVVWIAAVTHLSLAAVFVLSLLRLRGESPRVSRQFRGPLRS